LHRPSGAQALPPQQSPLEAQGLWASPQQMLESQLSTGLQQSDGLKQLPWWGTQPPAPPLVPDDPPVPTDVPVEVCVSPAEEPPLEKPPELTPIEPEPPAPPVAVKCPPPASPPVAPTVEQQPAAPPIAPTIRADATAIRLRKLAPLPCSFCMAICNGRILSVILLVAWRK
jgi:hypothetical protein